MRSLIVPIFLALVALAHLVSGQPAIGEHEFQPITVSLDAQANFPADSRVVVRNYTVSNPVPSVVRAIGYRVAVNNGSNAATVAVNVIAAAFNTISEPTVTVAYFGAKAGIAVSPSDDTAALGFSSAALAIAARFMGIVEYEDLNSNGQVDFPNEVIGGYDLGAATYSAIEYGSATQGGATYYYAQTETTDGVFAVRVVGGGNFITVSEGTTTIKINPTTIKSSISIRYYNNTQNTARAGLTNGPSSNPNAQLALVVGFGAIAARRAAGLLVTNKTAAQQDFNGNALSNVELSSNAAAFVGGFSWVANADARNSNGQSVAGGAVVHASFFDTIPGNSSYATKVVAGAYTAFKFAKLAVYSFAQVRPTSIVWDPAVSTVDVDSASAAMVPALAALLIALTSLAL